MSLLHRSQPKAPDAPTTTEPQANTNVEPPPEPVPATEATTGQLVVRLELPGLDPDKDVEVTVFDGVLRIHAERQEEATGEDGTSRSFSYSYVRSMSLPAGAAEGITATYRDDVLEVHVPIPEAKAEAKRIPISRT